MNVISPSGTAGSQFGGRKAIPPGKDPGTPHTLTERGVLFVPITGSPN